MIHPTWPEDESIWQQPDDERALAMWALHTATETARYLQMTLNMSSMFPSKWLKAADLQGKRVKVTIGTVDMEKFMDGTAKPAIHFPGRDKGLILNKTNALKIASAYGPDAIGWIGKTIELFPTQVEWKGELVDAIRIAIPEDVSERQPVAQEAAEAELNDDIPF